MATVAFVWELGAGLGHVLPHQDTLHQLKDAGHEIHLIVKDVSRLDTFFGEEFRYWQSPIHNAPVKNRFQPTLTMAHIMHNVGFHDHSALAARISSWRNLFETIQPDLVVTDYSPTALLALTDNPVKKAIINTGFFIPPPFDTFPPYPVFRKVNLPRVFVDERNLLRTINMALVQRGLPTISSPLQIFNAVDEQFLTTYRELDHFQERKNGHYLGIPPATGGVPPEWPIGTRRKVFAYLKPFPSLETLLQLLQQLELPTIIACDGIPEKLKQKYHVKTIHYVDSPVDLNQVSLECDVAITNANHATMTRLLLAGKPVLSVPLALEQEILAQVVHQLGAGVVVNKKEPNAILRGMQQLLNEQKYRQGAEAFAERYTLPTSASYTTPIVERLTALLN